MGQTSYTITKLKGRQNYDSWKEDMSSLLILDKTWLVVTGIDPQPTTPVHPHIANAGEIFATVTATIKPGEVETYTKCLEDFKAKTLAWEDKNSRACALIRLNCAEGSGPRTHIHGISYSFRTWKVLEKQYEASDLATLDLSRQTICRYVQTDFKDLSTYGENIKSAASNCAEMGKVIPTWMLGSFFRTGLSTDLESYTFQLVQASKDSAQELTIDDMMAALVDHDKRSQYLEDTKALQLTFAIEVTNQRLGRKPSPALSLERIHPLQVHLPLAPPRRIVVQDRVTIAAPSFMLNRNATTFIGYPHMRPDGWKPMQGKEHLIKNHKGGGAKAVRAMKMAFSTRTTENVWYLDSAAKVHITYDRSDFETFAEEPTRLSSPRGRKQRYVIQNEGLGKRLLQGS